MAEIFYGKIYKRLDENRYVVKRLNNAAGIPDYKLYYIATLGVPLPSGSLRVNPDTDNITNFNCFCALDGFTCVVLCFTVSYGMSTFNDQEVTALEHGAWEMRAGNTGSIKGYADGSIGLYSDIYSKILLEPKPQSIFIQVRNYIHRFWTGFITVLTNGDSAVYTFFMSKYLDKTALPQYATDIKPDNVKIEIGTVPDDSALVRESINADYDNTGTPSFNMISRKATDDNAMSTTYTDTNTGGNVNWTIGKDGSIDYTNQKLTLHIDQDGSAICDTPGSSIIIDTAGNTILKLVDGANIFLGGTDNEQPLVTKAWIDQVFANHMHASAAPGSPSPPLPIPLPPVTSDSKTNFYTNTTLGE